MLVEIKSKSPTYISSILDGLYEFALKTQGITYDESSNCLIFSGASTINF